MQITDEETFLVQLAITGLLDVFNRMQGRNGLDPALIEGMINTFGVINTHTSIGVNLVMKIDQWHRSHPGIQQKIAAQLRDLQGGARLVDLDGKPFGT